MGSSNLDYSGLNGGNREYDYERTALIVVANLVAIFYADWYDKTIHLDNPGPLIELNQ